MNDFIAHTNQFTGEIESGMHHLNLTADLAERFGLEIGAPRITRQIALLHDVGKMTDKFSQVLEHKKTGVDHAFTGAVAYLKTAPKQMRSSVMKMICLEAIAGHHSYIGAVLSRARAKNATGFKEYNVSLWDEEDFSDSIGNEGKECSLSDLKELDAICQYIEDNNLIMKIKKTEYPAMTKKNMFAQMMWARMIMSCLVDADYTATASFSNGKYLKVADQIRIDAIKMNQNLTDYRTKLIERKKPQSEAQMQMNALRNYVYDAATKAGKKECGFYRMSAPTGTGKTLALMKFAIEQAIENGLSRIIVVLPYLSIIQQNASEYKQIFGDGIVLESDSEAEIPDEMRIYSERWNTPVIVTTTVSFFETLHSSGAMKLRKLHQIANSVIVFDEAQVLPTDVTDTSIKSLESLVTDFHCSVLFSTATQPPYSFRKVLADVPMKEVIPDPDELYEKYHAVKKTTVEFAIEKDETAAKPGQFRQWEPYEVIDKLTESNRTQILVISNTVAKAKAMYDEMQRRYNEDDCFLLSADLCKKHKADIIEEIRYRLDNKIPCYVSATQCVEAGVDFDFEAGAREYGPFSSIVQAAGRVNRNGKYDDAYLFVFYAGKGFPDDTYRNESWVVRFLAEKYNGKLDLDKAPFLNEYFKKLFDGDGRESGDKPELAEACKKGDLHEVELQYKIIDNVEQANVIVCYKPMKDVFEKISKELSSSKTPYVVSKHRFKSLLAETRSITVQTASSTKIEWAKAACHHILIQGIDGTIERSLYIADTDPENQYNMKTGLCTTKAPVDKDIAA